MTYFHATPRKISLIVVALTPYSAAKIPAIFLPWESLTSLAFSRISFTADSDSLFDRVFLFCSMRVAHLALPGS